ncbi:MAG TPA: ribosomal protein S18-alanine N-acetyltransferase [Syntrophales bacterium]|nr:ribosomal protein S18-alanine N-acetyltransferase [Syntrophales bacterium]
MCDAESALTVSIEAMKPGDLPEVVAIADDPQGVPWTRGIFEKELATPFSRNLVCRADLGTGAEVVAGFISFWAVAGEVQLHNVAVRRDLRRRGIGLRLMEAMFRTARDEGAGCITLEMRESNRAARRLYERFGFAEAGSRPGYYRDRREAAVIFRADLEKGTGAGNGPYR